MAYQLKHSKSEIDILDPCSTTEKDYELFVKEVDWWLDYMGLKDWYVETEWAVFNDESRSNFRYDIEGMIAAIGLNKSWETDIVTERKIRLCVFHEVIELMLAELRYLIETRKFDVDAMHTAIHRVVRRLENTLFKLVQPELEEGNNVS